MNAKILNRDFQHPTDGWYQIEPKGDHPNRAAKVVQVIDDESINTIVNRFNTDAAAGSLRHGQEMLIDHEHFSGDTSKESRAYGWLQELQNRADGIYGRIRWTSTGRAAVDGGDYRFFSTEYDPADLKIVNDGKVKKVRPLRLDGLSLTNMNNNRGQKPITNRAEFRSTAAADSQQQQKTTGQKMKSVCTLLELSADASEEAVYAAVAKLKNRGDISATDLVIIRNRADITPDALKELKGQVVVLLEEQVDGLLAHHQVKEEKVINRLKPVLTAMKNREDRVAALLDFGFKPLEAGKQGTQTRVINRQDGKPGAATEQPADDQERAEKIRNRCDELTSGGMKFEAAFQKASREIPATA